VPDDDDGRAFRLVWVGLDDAPNWSEAWQRGEADAQAALDAGEGREFESAEVAISWLKSDHD